MDSFHGAVTRGTWCRLMVTCGSCKLASCTASVLRHGAKGLRFARRRSLRSLGGLKKRMEDLGLQLFFRIEE